MSSEGRRRSRYARAPGVLWRRVADEILVLAPAAEDPAVLSAAAAVVWEELETSPLMTELTGSLALAFGRDPDAMRADVERILTDLERLGLVVEEDPSEFVDA